MKNHAMILDVMKTKDKDLELIIPILDDEVEDINDEEETKLSEKLKKKLEENPLYPAVLIRGRGLFVWAKDINECIMK